MTSRRPFSCDDGAHTMPPQRAKTTTYTGRPSASPTTTRTTTTHTTTTHSTPTKTTTTTTTATTSATARPALRARSISTDKVKQVTPTKEQHDKMMNAMVAEQAGKLSGMSWDDIFNPVKARKEKVIQEQRKVAGLRSSSEHVPTIAKAHIVTQGSADRVGKLKELPALMRSLKSSDVRVRVEALNHLALITDTTTQQEDEVIGKAGVMNALLVSLKDRSQPALVATALTCLLHLTLVDHNRESLALEPGVIEELVDLAMEGNDTASGVLNNAAPNAKIRERILEAPKGHGVQVLGKMARERRPLYKKGTTFAGKK